MEETSERRVPSRIVVRIERELSKGGVDAWLRQAVTIVRLAENRATVTRP